MTGDKSNDDGDDYNDGCGKSNMVMILREGQAQGRGLHGNTLASFCWGKQYFPDPIRIVGL